MKIDKKIVILYRFGVPFGVPFSKIGIPFGVPHPKLSSFLSKNNPKTTILWHRIL
jgi:hypothetical protein